MPSNTSTFAPILRPDQVGELVLRPLIQQSVAGQVLTAVTTGAHNHRIPVVNTDPSASWTAEGAEIDVSDADIDEVIITPSKLAGLTVITRELANDSNPAAQDVVGQGITRDLVRKTDEALFTATTTNGPGGVPGVSGVATVSAGASYTNVDAFSDALYTAEQVNATITAWVTNPATAKTLAKVKELSGSNKPLLQPDPTMPGRRQILGVPLLVSPYVQPPTRLCGASASSIAYMVVREKAEVEADRSVFFTSDRVAVRAIMRLGFGFAHPPSIVKITTTS